MKNRIFIFIILLCVNAHTQSWQWGKRGGSSDPLDTNSIQRAEEVYSIISDGNKNIYALSTVGISELNIDGHPKINFGDSNSKTDYAISSFGCDGAYRWSKIIGGSGWEEIQPLQIDSQNNIYVTGKFGGCQDSMYPPRIDSDVIIYQNPSDCSAIFLAKYSPDGNLLWFKRPQQTDVTLTVGLAQTFSKGLATDSAGNSYWLVNIPPGSYADGAFNNTLSGSNWYIFKYDNNGIFLNATFLDMQMAGGTGALHLKFYRNPHNGYFYITDFRQLTYPITIAGEAVAHSAFIACFNDIGQFLWKRENTSDTFGSLQWHNLVFDEENNIYTSFRFLGGGTDSFQTFTIPNPIVSAVVMKLNPDASAVSWSTYYNYNGAQKGAVVLNGDEVAFSGLCFGTNFTWGSQSIFASNPNEGTETLLARFNKDSGDCIALSKIPGDVTYDDAGTSIIADASGDYIVGGGFTHTIYFDGNASITNIGQQTDFFVAKYATSPCSPLGIGDYDMAEIGIMPNPAFNEININTDKEMHYRIFDVQGKLLMEGELQQRSIDVSPLTKGLYLLQVQDEGDGMRTFKFLKD